MHLKHPILICTGVGAVLGVLPGLALYFLPWDSAAIRMIRVIDWIPERITDQIHAHITGGAPEERFFILLLTVFVFWLFAGFLIGLSLHRCSAVRGTHQQ
jgi:F0F1-type ATP synthase membrane subunit a